MNVGARLALDLVEVEAGTRTPLGIRLHNHGEDAETLELAVEGLDPSWTTLPEPMISLAAGESREAQVAIRVVREPESAAGSYPFVVRLRSLNTGEVLRLSATLVLKPFHGLSVDIEPRQVSVGSLKPEAAMTVRVLNVGNTEHEVQLSGQNTERELAFEFETDRLVIGPGQQKRVELKVRGQRRTPVRARQILSMGVTARSQNDPTVANHAMAEVEVQPLLSPGVFAALLAVLLLAVSWFVTIPRPPRVEMFSVSKTRIVENSPVEISWRVEDAATILLTGIGPSGRAPIRAGTDAAGTVTFAPPTSGTWRVEIEARRADKIVRREITLTVEPPQIAPLPTIEDFRLSRRQVRAGERVEVTYRLGRSVRKAEIFPLGLTLDLSRDSFEFQPSWIGPQAVRIVAHNADGARVERSIELRVLPAEIRAPAPEIASFEVLPLEVPSTGGEVAIAWRLRSAVRAEILIAGAPTPVDSVSGTLRLTFSAETELTLRGYGVDGRMVERRVVVRLKPDTSTGLPDDPASPTTPTPVPSLPNP